MFTMHAETKRLVIRPVTMDDYAAYVAGFRSCGAPKNRFDEQFDTACMTAEWFAALIERREREAERDYAYKFHLFQKETGKSVGYCNIYPHYREDFQYGHIGYAIHNTFWGNGYATECVTALVRLGFDCVGLHRLEAHVNLDNPASAHVLEKAGFTFECIRKGFILEDGVWTDNLVYCCFNSDVPGIGK